MSDQPLQAKNLGKPSEADQAWLKHIRQEQQEAPKRMEETAKYLAAIISISLTIFLGQRPDSLPEWTTTPLLTAALLWMLAAVVSFFVLFPWPYRYAPDSPGSIEATYRRITRVKLLLLIGAVVCYLVALGLGTWAFLGG